MDDAVGIMVCPPSSSPSFSSSPPPYMHAALKGAVWARGSQPCRWVVGVAAEVFLTIYLIASRYVSIQCVHYQMCRVAASTGYGGCSNKKNPMRRNRFSQGWTCWPKMYDDHEGKKQGCKLGENKMLKGAAHASSGSDGMSTYTPNTSVPRECRQRPAAGRTCIGGYQYAKHNLASRPGRADTSRHIDSNGDLWRLAPV
ncbi:hypothetical protein LZ30DRAFT_4159 [Colletotrichum cereale]|nr:hypothetical protein LZ30DRAFT_4159 [Colletotrichum cereale]